MATNNFYEITVILDANFDDKAIQVIIDRTTEFIGKHEGTVKSTDHWGRKKLAYIIDKKTNGYYFQLGVDAPGNFVHLLERHFYIDNDIMRYLIINMDEKELKKRSESIKALNKVAADIERLLNPPPVNTQN